MPKVSIVVPVYNVEQYLGRCIESLINQTLEDIEIILVDDGSPDKSGEICDKYATQDSRIKVLHKKNGGVSAARNDGLRIAVGEYIIFCDSDDWMEIDACKNLYNKAMETKADVVIGDVYMAYDEGHNKYVYFYKKDFASADRSFIDKMIQADFYRNYCPMPPSSGPAFGYGGPWNKLVRRQMLIDSEITFDIRLKGIFDDILYTAYILAVSDRVAYVQKPVYYYRQVVTSLTASYKKNTLEINDEIFTAWRNFINKYGKKGQFEKPYCANVVRRLAESLPIYFFNKKNPASLDFKLQELKQIMCSDPYSYAANNVDTTILSKYHKAIAFFMRQRNARGLWILFSGKEIVKKVLRR